jgi:hypothetical protein
MNPWHHAQTSAKKFGGKPEDYLAIHHWFDETKSAIADARHRALRHHAFGIFECEKLFGHTITNSSGKEVPVRLVGEQHVREDCGGFIPSVQDWVKEIRPRPWMNKGYPESDVEDLGAKTINVKRIQGVFSTREFPRVGEK